MSRFSQEELLICEISRMLNGVNHVAVGVSSPIPGSAAILQNALGGVERITVLNSKHENALNDGASELFDMAAQGRIGAFFLSGGQIDGCANINLLGIGAYPEMKVRWSGSFGSALLYHLIPKVILFRQEHTRRTLVEAVDFISAPGPKDDGVFRPGGPFALVTGRCVFDFDNQRKGFRLRSLHPGVNVEEIIENTGFSFDIPEIVTTTAVPTEQELTLLRNEVGSRIRDPYPNFAKQVWG